MKKSTFKKAGVAVLSMAMLLSIGSTALVASAAPIPDGTGEYAKTISLPANADGYMVYQIANAVKQDGIWQYTVDPLFNSVIYVKNNKMVAATDIIGDSSLNGTSAQIAQNGDYQVAIPADTELKTILSNSSQAEALAAALATVAEGSENFKMRSVAGSSTDTTINVESGYYLIVSNGDNVKTEPILVDVQNQNATIASLKWSEVDVDKIITDISKGTITTAGDYINSDATDENQVSHYGQALGGSTVSFKIDTEFPNYNAKVATNNTDITDFVITDTPDNTLVINNGNISTDAIHIKVTDGSDVFVSGTAGAGETALVQIAPGITTGDFKLEEIAAVADTPYDDNGTPDNDADDTAFAKGHGKGFKVTFSDAFVLAHGGATVEITYDAVLSTDPYLASDDLSNDNKVKLTYSNNYDTGIGSYDPNGDPDPNTPKETDEKKDVIVCTDFTVNKLDENGDPIKGAKFKLLKLKTGETAATAADALALSADKWDEIEEIDGTVNQQQSITGKDTFEFKGLTEGWYKIVETQAPTTIGSNGQPIPTEYVTVDDSVFQITNTGSKSTTYTTTFNFTNNPNINDRALSIQNFKGQTLPGTGGIGTYLFTFGGAAVILMAGAMFVMYMKKREVEE